MRFYDEVREQSSASARRLPHCRAMGACLAQIGASSGFGEAGYATLERQWTRPTLDVNGMWGGYQGSGQKTVIPGTVPILELFQRDVGLDMVFFSFSIADEDSHAPNEFFHLHRLYVGLEAWARLWHILGKASA